MLVWNKMLLLFLLMLVGFLVGKRGILTREVLPKISSLIVNIANPALILSGSISRDTAVSARDFVFAFGVAAALFAVLIGVAAVLPQLMRVQTAQRGTYRAMTVFSNIGFMGLPIISALYGETGLLYGTLFLLPYNLLVYTYGIRAIQPQHGAGRGSIRQAFNIGVVACLLAIVIHFCAVPVPSAVAAVVESLSGLTAPLSMLVIGASMVSIRWREMFGDKTLLLFAGIRLLIIPLLGMLAVNQVVGSEVLRGISLVLLAMPVGNMTAMLAQEYGGDAETASKGIVLTTICSMVTFPLISHLCM